MKIKAMIEISIFAVLTAVGARLMVPVPFVPFTLQTLVCMLAGLLLGPKRGAASQALYMAMGLIGIPVFTSVAGPAAVLMPSFGYILGFIGCAWLSGCLRDMFFKKYGSVTRLQYFAAAMAGVAVVYLIGVAYLYVILNFWVKSGGATFLKSSRSAFSALSPATRQKRRLPPSSPAGLRPAAYSGIDLRR